MVSPWRTYAVGLPVIVTVHDDGQVTLYVDLSETAKAVAEDDGIYVDEHGNDLEYDEADIKRDSEAVEAKLDRLSTAFVSIPLPD